MPRARNAKGYTASQLLGYDARYWAMHPTRRQRGMDAWAADMRMLTLLSKELGAWCFDLSPHGYAASGGINRFVPRGGITLGQLRAIIAVTRALPAPPLGGAGYGDVYLWHLAESPMPFPGWVRLCRCLAGLATYCSDGKWYLNDGVTLQHVAGALAVAFA